MGTKRTKNVVFENVPDTNCLILICQLNGVCEVEGLDEPGCGPVVVLGAAGRGHASVEARYLSYLFVG